MHQSIKNFISILLTSYHFYAKNLFSFLRVIIIIFIPLFIIDRLFFMRTQFDAISFAYFKNTLMYIGDQPFTLALFIFIATLVGFITIALFLLFQIVILKTYEKIDQKKQVCTGNIFHESIWLFFPYSLVFILFVFWASVWSLLFIIPGLVVGFFYSFAICAFMFDNKRGNEALSYSKKIIKSDMKRTAGNIVGMLGIVCCLYLILVLFLEYIFAVHIQCDPATKARMGELLQDLVTIIFAAYPLIFITVLYKDMRNKFQTS